MKAKRPAVKEIFFKILPLIFLFLRLSTGAILLFKIIRYNNIRFFNNAFLSKIRF